MLVSVVIPVFNSERFVAAAIESVLAQSFRDLEVIVVDDGSTDRTYSIASRVSDPRVILLRFPNSGVSAARNRGIRAATGEIIAFLDADDLWDPCKLEIQMKLLGDPKVSAVGSKMRYLSARSGWAKGLAGESVASRQLDIELGAFMPFPISSAIFRGDVVRSIGGFDEELTQAEDLDFMARVAARGEVLLVDEVLGSYRVHSNSATTLDHRRQLEVTKFVQARLAARASGGDLSWSQFEQERKRTLRERRETGASVHFRAAGLAFADGRLVLASTHLAQSLALRPVFTVRRLAHRIR